MLDPKSVEVMIASDRNMEVGLHTTLWSMLDSLQPEYSVRVHLFLADFNSEHILRLRETISGFANRCTLEVYDYASIKQSISGRSLHGSLMPYAILTAPTIIPTSRVLCLDADLIVRTCVGRLYDCDLRGKTCAAVRDQIWAKERLTLENLGVPNVENYFNTGVVLFDCVRWKELNYFERARQIAGSSGGVLVTADQTLLNACLPGDVMLLPDHYNIRVAPCEPSAPIAEGKDAIWHFVGSPKPWDMLGEFVHGSYESYSYFLSKTAVSDFRSYQRLNRHSMLRTVKTLRSYITQCRLKWTRR